MRVSSLISSALCTSLALAQGGVIVSPAGFDILEGDSNNVFPFGQTTARRYMQLHGDLGTTPLLITTLSFRVNASSTNYTGTRVHDLEVYMGDAVPTAITQPSMVFDANYAAPKATVLPRTNVTWGPQGQSVTPGPNPFNGSMDILLPAPHIYLGTSPLIWEVAYFGNTTTGTMSNFDADATAPVTATSTVTGLGCPPTGSATAMTHTYSVSDVSGTLMMNGTITGGPANSLAIMAIGLNNPNLTFPGLCANVYTDAVVTQVLGFTSATGAYTADNPTGAFFAPNSLTGVQLFTQAFVVDPASTASIPFTCSNGRVSTVPAVGTAPLNQVTRLWTTATGTGGSMAFFTTSTVGYGLVTQFTHL